MKWVRNQSASATEWVSDDFEYRIRKEGALDVYTLLRNRVCLGRFGSLPSAQLEAVRIEAGYTPSQDIVDDEEEEEEALSDADVTRIAGKTPAYVAAFRTERYVYAGMPYDDARRLAVLEDLDWHRVVDLLGDGCSPELAEAIVA